MKTTRQLQDLSQSLWLDNITRGMLTDGTLRRSMDELSVTGLTSNPTIFDHAIRNGGWYDAAIRQGAVADKVPPALRNRLGIAIAKRPYQVYRDVLASPRWRRLAGAGARPQRLLWASTGTKDPAAPDTLYVEALAAADTIDTIPEKTLHAFADHGRVSGALAFDGGDAEDVIAEFARHGVDDTPLAARLQREGVESFDKSWQDLPGCIAATRAKLAPAGHAATGRA